MRSGSFCISIVASDWGQCVPWNGIISAECYCLATDPAQQLPSAHPFGTCWHLTTLLSWASIWLQHFRPLTCRPVAIFSVAACFRMLSSGQWDPSLQTKMTIWHMKACFWSVFVQHAFKNSPDNVFGDNYLKGGSVFNVLKRWIKFYDLIDRLKT